MNQDGTEVTQCNWKMFHNLAMSFRQGNSDQTRVECPLSFHGHGECNKRVRNDFSKVRYWASIEKNERECTRAYQKQAHKKEPNTAYKKIRGHTIVPLLNFIICINCTKSHRPNKTLIHRTHISTKIRPNTCFPGC